MYRPSNSEWCRLYGSRANWLSWFPTRGAILRRGLIPTLVLCVAPRSHNHYNIQAGQRVFCKLMGTASSA